MSDTIAETKLGDDGAVLLGKALESPNCKLTTLELEGKLPYILEKQFHGSDVSATSFGPVLTHTHTLSPLC